MKTLIFFLFGLLVFQELKSQEDSLIGPHKGRLKTDGGYKIEVLGCNDYLEIYLYNSQLEPIHNYNIMGEAKFYYEGETYKRVDLVYYGNDGFTAQITTPGFFYCKITLDISGRVYAEKFENECIVLNSKK